MNVIFCKNKLSPDKANINTSFNPHVTNTSFLISEHEQKFPEFKYFIRKTPVANDAFTDHVQLIKLNVKSSFAI